MATVVVIISKDTAAQGIGTCAFSRLFSPANLRLLNSHHTVYYCIRKMTFGIQFLFVISLDIYYPSSTPTQEYDPLNLALTYIKLKNDIHLTLNHQTKAILLTTPTLTLSVLYLLNPSNRLKEFSWAFSTFVLFHAVSVAPIFPSPLRLSGQGTEQAEAPTGRVSYTVNSISCTDRGTMIGTHNNQEQDQAQGYDLRVTWIRVQSLGRRTHHVMLHIVCCPGNKMTLLGWAHQLSIRKYCMYITKGVQIYSHHLLVELEIGIGFWLGLVSIHSIEILRLIVSVRLQYNYINIPNSNSNRERVI